MKKQPEPYAHTFTVDGRQITARVVPLDVGFEVYVPILDGEQRFYDDSLDAALAEAQKRLVAADREFRMREDPVREAFGRTGEHDGHTFDVTVTKRVSGRYEFGSADYPDVHHAHDDEETGFAEFIGKLSMARELREQAGTVDGERANIVHGNGAPQQLPIRTTSDCAAEVHRCQVELAKKLATEKAAKNARTDAETALDMAFAALLEAVDREAAPALPLEPVTA